MVLVLVIGAVVAAQVAPLAVRTTVVPPSDLSTPATVFLVDFGRTPSLVLTAADGRMLAYVYGDWEYYALRRQGARESIAALFWPTQGALGRKEIFGPATADAVRKGVGDVEHVYEFEVERAAVERLRTELDRLYREGLETATRSYGMTFVHHPNSYTYWSNSNHMTAGWLRELGCEVRGPAFASSWRTTSSSGSH